MTVINQKRAIVVVYLLHVIPFMTSVEAPPRWDGIHTIPMMMMMTVGGVSGIGMSAPIVVEWRLPAVTELVVRARPVQIAKRIVVPVVPQQTPGRRVCRLPQMGQFTMMWVAWDLIGQV